MMYLLTLKATPRCYVDELVLVAEGEALACKIHTFGIGNTDNWRCVWAYDDVFCDGGFDHDDAKDQNHRKYL